MSGAPPVCFVIPTLNSARTLGACLRSIHAQDAGAWAYEIVVADAGSADATREIAISHGARVVENPLRTGEAGKAAGIRATAAPLIALVDSDNVLPDRDWLRRMVAPLARAPDLFLSEPLEYAWRADDPPLTRYFALLGMNDPLCLFVGNYDRYSAMTGRWTGLSLSTIDRGDYVEVELPPAGMLPTIGANGTVIRRSVLEHVRWDPYYMDTDVVVQAVRAGFRRVAKVKCGIVHTYCRTLGDFARKQDRRVRDFLHFDAGGQRVHTWDTGGALRHGILRFTLETMLLVPLVAQCLRALRVRGDAAVWLHIPACWITLLVYGAASTRRLLGFRIDAHDRRSWRQ